MIFGELADIGLFAGLVMPIAGIIILSNSPNTINLIGGIALIIGGVLVIRWRLRNIVNEKLKEEMEKGS